MNKEYTYFVKGMHCASCEVLVEKKLLEIKGIKSVEAGATKGQVTIEYEGERPNHHHLTSLFKEENYTFFDRLEEENIKTNKSVNPTLFAFNIALFIIIAFLILNKSGVPGSLGVSSSSSLFA
ncbi:MAG: cation transporter, partial [Candidatus Staskawiczbacteria bacterium]|nr:cation transporter [Candidatus Staskawiczbacteria bacterium]